MADSFNFRVPGEVDGDVFVDKQILMYADHHINDRIAVTIAPNTGDLDKGTVLGISSDGLFRPVTRITVTATQPANPQVINAKVAGTGAKFQVGQHVSAMKADGTGIQDLGTVQGVVGDAITVSNELTAALADGDYLFVSDGSQKAVAILGDVVLDAPSPKIANAYVAGKFYLAQLVGVDPIVTNDLHARVINLGTNSYGVDQSLYIV